MGFGCGRRTTLVTPRFFICTAARTPVHWVAIERNDRRDGGACEPRQFIPTSQPALNDAISSPTKAGDDQQPCYPDHRQVSWVVERIAPAF